MQSGVTKDDDMIAQLMQDSSSFIINGKEYIYDDKDRIFTIEGPVEKKASRGQCSVC